MMWDVKKVFNYFEKLPKLSDLTLKEPSLKLAMLFVFFRVENQWKIEKSKPENHAYTFILLLLIFEIYSQDPKLSVVVYFKRNI